MLTDSDYQRLLDLRTRLRGFLRWSEDQARSAGVTPAQHQLLLAVRGHPDRRGPTVGEIADYLLLRHHSAVGLIDRADTAGLVVRVGDPEDLRLARVRLTPEGERVLSALSEVHVEELQRLARHLQPLLRGMEVTQETRGGSRTSE